MKATVMPGDLRLHHHKVTSQDFATFAAGTVHKVCSTFALAREMEWSSRLFVLDIKAEDEEGVGTMLEIQHHAPAFAGEHLALEAKVVSLEKNELICDITVRVADRLIATGRTGQKILKREKVQQIFTRLE